jgi:hypothetical protein
VVRWTSRLAALARSMARAMASTVVSLKVIGGVS